jgi:hypothetical protein
MGEFKKAGVLKAIEYPKYLKSIVEEAFISAPHALNHPFTSKFLENYFKPNGTLSLLDFILHDKGKSTGVIC